MLNKSGPKIEPCGTPNIISSQELNACTVLTFEIWEKNTLFICFWYVFKNAYWSVVGFCVFWIFFCTGVISTSLKFDGNTDNDMDQIWYANISLLFLITLVAISVYWQAFFTSDLFASLVVSSRETCLKLKAFSLWFSSIATTTESFLNLPIILKTGSPIWSASVRSPWPKDMFIFFTIFEKKALSVSATSRLIK